MTGLEEFIRSARWFGGKGRDLRLGDVRRLDWLGTTEPPSSEDAPGRVRIELVTVEYADGPAETYQLPLVYYPHVQERLNHAFVGQDEDPDLGEVYVYDALHDRYATALWLRAFAEERTTDQLAFRRCASHDLHLDAHSALFSGEQSNSSLRFGEDSLMKVFRKVTPGPNPDVEIHTALTEAGNDNVAALYGWLETRPGDGEEPTHLAMLQQFLRTGSDGWELALTSVRDLYAEGDLHADEVGGDFAAESHRLGAATAAVHTALAERFPTSELGSDELTGLSEAMAQRLDDAVASVPELEEHADAVREVFESVARIDTPVVVQRVHGDYHLGQTLRTVRGWKIVDFEGEPAKPLAERLKPDSAWRDVAGMLRSFDYAAHVVEADVEEGAQIAYRAEEWVERNQSAFLDGYVEARHAAADATTHASDTPSGPPGTRQHSRQPDEAEDEPPRGIAALEPSERTLLRAYVLDKAVYETLYEARNRPDWISIPLAAIARLTRAPEPASEATQETTPW